MLLYSIVPRTRTKKSDIVFIYFIPAKLILSPGSRISRIDKGAILLSINESRRLRVILFGRLAQPGATWDLLVFIYFLT